MATCYPFNRYEHFAASLLYVRNKMLLSKIRDESLSMPGSGPEDIFIDNENFS